jgi:hypothetical protein
LTCHPDLQAKKILKKKVVKKFTIDCSQPVDDGIMDAASFVRACPGPVSMEMQADIVLRQ